MLPKSTLGLIKRETELQFVESRHRWTCCHFEDGVMPAITVITRLDIIWPSVTLRAKGCMSRGQQEATSCHAPVRRQVFWQGCTVRLIPWIFSRSLRWKIESRKLIDAVTCLSRFYDIQKRGLLTDSSLFFSVHYRKVSFAPLLWKKQVLKEIWCSHGFKRLPTSLNNALSLLLGFTKDNWALKIRSIYFSEILVTAWMMIRDHNWNIV